jgi:hypothetical protein
MNTTLVRKNLARKNVDLRPLCLSSLFGITMGVLMLMTMPAPSAHAQFTQLLTYYNFNNYADGAPPPLASNTTDVPLTQSTTLANDLTNPFPSGNIHVDNFYPPGTTTQAGTMANQWDPALQVPPGNPAQTADTSGGATATNGALDLAGNANLTSKSYCFTIGAINTTGFTDIKLSFEIASVGNGGQFDTLALAYSTTGAGGTFTPLTLTSPTPTLGTNTHGAAPLYQLVTASLDNVQSNNLYIQFCFSGASNNANGNDTLIDNIQVTARVPEPGTYIGGLLGVVGLCWYQRRWLIRSLRLRRA